MSFIRLAIGYVFLPYFVFAVVQAKFLIKLMNWATVESE